MQTRFGRFVLDERGRTLRLDGKERPLQPLLFDLLVYLVQNRDRVVPKDELLEKLWVGATVTDGSLQRAISLLRAELREGGMAEAVQTFARRGYRFCESIDADGRSVPNEARKLADAGEWARALEVFGAISDRSGLSAEDWEAWANAAMCAGLPQQSVMPLENAVASFEQAGDPQAAARTSLLLCNVKLEGRELAIAKGWHQRALGYLKSEPEGKEHGLAAWLSSRLALFEGRLDECRAHARDAQEIADRIGDPDLHCLGLVYQGHILIAQSDVRRGLALHDEAGAAALAGRVSPWVSGIVFCSVIWAYLHLGDHHRAGQWTDEFERWCERHSSFCYPALCRLHRGEILAMRGELVSAETEVRLAREQLTVAGPFVEGDACRVLGEIRLSLGDLEGAERYFREAHRLGWNPQPGWSVLLAERGNPDGALKQLESALGQPSWTDGQRRGVMLAVLARIAAMHGHAERAASALAELGEAPELTATQIVLAERARSEGELAWVREDWAAAERALRSSIAHFLEMNAPLHAAQVRLRLSRLFLNTKDTTAAELELGSAQAAFEQVGAEALAQSCQELRTTFP